MESTLLDIKDKKIHRERKVTLALGCQIITTLVMRNEPYGPSLGH